MKRCQMPTCDAKATALAWGAPGPHSGPFKVCEAHAAVLVAKGYRQFEPEGDMGEEAFG